MRPHALLLCLGLSACSNSASETRDPEPTAHDRTATAGHEEPAKMLDAPPAKAPAAGPNYEIATTPQTTPFKVGGEGRVEVRLTGRNGYHVNQEYPIELTLQPPAGLKLAKAKLVRADASAFEEAQAVFPIGLTPEAAGRKALRGTLNFSVCNPQNCLLERQDVAVEIDAVP